MDIKKIADPKWRLTNLYYIVDKNGHKIKYTPNKPQAFVNQSKSKRKIALKSRQIGFSTNEILKQFDYTIFNKNITSVILAHEQDAIEKLFRIVKRAYTFMPEEIRPKLEKGGGSKYEFYFPAINSRIYCDLESRGDTIQWLHISECAFMKDSSRLKSTLQAVPLNGIATIESTPNGLGNYFYEIWNDPDQIYEKFFFPWYKFDEYKLPVKNKLDYSEEEIVLIDKAKALYNVDITQEQIAFRRLKKQELKSYSDDKKQVPFEQEYPEDENSCFISSGSTVIDLIIIDEMMNKAKPPIKDKDGLKIYDTIDKHERYVCGVDVAEGIGGDYSVGIVMEVRRKKVVAMLRGYFKPYDFADKLDKLCRLYSHAETWPLLAVERNNHGHAVLLELSEHLQYKNLYVHDDEKLGWRTDKISRPIMINAFIASVENKYITINDKIILNECLTLINNNGKIEAASGKHDDCIMATSIALQMIIKFGNLDVYDNIKSKILV